MKFGGLAPLFSSSASLFSWRAHRMESRSTCCFVFLFLLFFLSPSYSIGGRHRARARARSLFRSAESLIRDFNLLPGIQELGAEIEEEDPSSPHLFERRLNLPILGESGLEVPIEQLGHYAGYYRLEHTHAAKYDSSNPTFFHFVRAAY